MRALLSLIVGIVCIGFVAGNENPPNLAEVDCQIKQAALSFCQTKKISTKALGELKDALRLKDCPAAFDQQNLSAELATSSRKLKTTLGAIDVFVSPSGSDNSKGSMQQPFQTAARARDYVREVRQQSGNMSSQATVHFREGKYFFSSPLVLDARDSFTSYESYNGEHVVFSGAQPFQNLSWTVSSENENVLIAENAKLPSGVDKSYIEQLKQAQSTQRDESTGHNYGPAPQQFNSLFVNGKRQTRARYPNGNPDDDSGLCYAKSDYANEGCPGYSQAQAMYNNTVLPKSEKIASVNLGPNRGDSPTLGCKECTHGYQSFGYNIYNPPTGHPVYNKPLPFTKWMNNSFFTKWADLLVRPGAIQTSKSSEGWSPNGKEWGHPETGIVHMFHTSLWGGWQYQLVDRTTLQDGSDALMFGYGGYQEARGHQAISGNHFFVENIQEELDAPLEWFYDFEKEQLFLYPESDQLKQELLQKPAEVDISAAIQTSIIEIGVDGDESISQHISFSGIEFTETRTTFMDIYEVPSGGDWSIHRKGTVMIANSANVTVEQNMFSQVGGNAIVMNNHVVNTTIQFNEFSHPGDSAIVSVGRTTGMLGTEKSFPNQNNINENVMHDIGIYGKQTSCYFQSVTAQASFTNNICFNGPRAGINFNDGFYGNYKVSSNFVGFMVRESGDHGPFNSWDRQPYATNNGVDDGFTPEQRGAPAGTSIIAAENIINQNFFLNGYNGVWTIDHDDSSQFYNDTDNVMAYGGCKNFLGHSKSCDHNLIIFPGIDNRSSGSRPCQTDGDGLGFENQFYFANDCITYDGINYDWERGCGAENVTEVVYKTWDNRFYAPEKKFANVCGTDSFDGWQALKQDAGSQREDLPSPAEIASMIRKKLHL